MSTTLLTLSITALSAQPSRGQTHYTCCSEGCVHQIIPGEQYIKVEKVFGWTQRQKPPQAPYETLRYCIMHGKELLHMLKHK